MALLGELSVNLMARTAKFEGDMKRARGSVDRFGKSAKGASLNVKGLATAIAGSVAVAGATRWFNAQRESLDSLGKASARLGITNQSLQVYQHAASLAGVSTEELNTGLERMRRQLGSALLGDTGAIKVFTRLGVSAEEIAKAEDPLVAIQNALAGIADVDRRSKLLQDIFGRGGAGFANLFQQNLGGVRNEMQKLNLLVTNKLVKGMENFNDKMTVMGAKAEAAGRRILEKLIDPMISGLDKIDRLMTSLGPWFGAVGAFQKEAAVHGQRSPREFFMHGAAAARNFVTGADRQARDAQSEARTAEAFHAVQRRLQREELQLLRRADEPGRL